MPNDYSLSDLVKLTGVSPRTVRYYISQGLLPSPIGMGAGARYGDVHLDRLRAIRRLQAANQPLSEIRRRLAMIPGDQVAMVADTAAAHSPPDSALEYIDSLLGGSAARRLPPATLPSGPSTTPPPGREPDRAQWDRITLDPDVELHIRRPLSRLQNKRVERLISIARQVLEEE